MGLARVADIMDIADIADILQIYCRYIAADCGRLRWITVKNGRL